MLFNRYNRSMKKVGLFVTCLVDALRPQIGIAALSLLRATGACVVYPQTQTCCGQIAFSSGYQQHARAIISKCAAEFSHCDCVVIPSGSCSGTFRAHIPDVFPEPDPVVENFRHSALN